MPFSLVQPNSGPTSADVMLPSILRIFNLQIARIYVIATDPAMVSLDWQDAMQAIVATKTGETRRRRETVAKDKALPASPIKARLGLHAKFIVKMGL